VVEILILLLKTIKCKESIIFQKSKISLLGKMMRKPLKCIAISTNFHRKDLLYPYQGRWPIFLIFPREKSETIFLRIRTTSKLLKRNLSENLLEKSILNFILEIIALWITKSQTGTKPFTIIRIAFFSR
jgi:hypothetical protein